MFVKDRVRRKKIAPIDMEDFKVLDEETDAVYLSYEEIGKIYTVDLSKYPYLIQYRDLFVLGCLTGLRFSDYSTLHFEDLRNGMLYKKTDKKDTWVVIPLRAEAKEIFIRVFKDSQPKISNPKFNKYIKIIANLAGITQNITFSHKRGNADIVETKPKSEWVTSHTCRRSFATNEYLNGVEVSLIMKITGHKTHKDFFKYIRISEEHAARKIQDIWTTRNNMQTFEKSQTL
jgi:integrase